jgi:hypothetical protein
LSDRADGAGQFLYKRIKPSDTPRPMNLTARQWFSSLIVGPRKQTLRRTNLALRLWFTHLIGTIRLTPDDHDGDRHGDSWALLLRYRHKARYGRVLGQHW